MNKQFAARFAKEWLAAWNAHDLPLILSHYADDFEMFSPAITQLTGKQDGHLQGKQAVSAYWAKALALFPNLRFEPLCTLVGTDSVALHYLSATGKRAAEVFEFNADGLVSRARAHYEP